MAGFREFVTGEVLTAANVNNFLMKQSVMVFADAAARTAALGAEVAEGMLTYNEDTAQLEVFDGTNFVLAAPAPPAGIGSNVVQAVKTDTFSTSSKTFGDITGLTVTITPTSVSSKVLLLARLSTGATATANWGFAFRFNGGNADDFVGDADGNKTRSAHGFTQDNFPPFNQLTVALSFVDSPATTSPTTYAVQVKGGGSDTGTIFINRASSQDNTELTSRNASSLIAIEVAA